MQKEIRKNQEAAYMFGFICVDFGYREIQFIGLCERLGSGMLFTAEGKMLIHSNSFSRYIKRGHCHALQLLCIFLL